MMGIEEEYGSQSSFESIGSVLARVIAGDGSSRSYFDPPYDSPIEENLAWNLVNFLSPSANLRSQVSVQTLGGRFYLDFVISINDIRIGIECDGRAFHNFERDEWRDALILGDGAVDSIWRFPGSDIFLQCRECIYQISRVNGVLFSAGGLHTLSATSRIVETRNTYERSIYGDMHIPYYNEDENGDTKISYLSPTFRGRRDSHSRWRILYDFAERRPNCAIDELIYLHNGQVASF